MRYLQEIFLLTGKKGLLHLPAEEVNHVCVLRIPDWDILSELY